MPASPVAPSPRILKVIWIAFMAAIVFYLVVAWKLTSVTEALTMPMGLAAAMALAAVGTVVAGFVLPPIVARQQAAAATEPLPPLAIYQTAMIVRWACFEAVAIYGFVLTIASRQYLPIAVGAVLALALLASSPPRPESVES